MTLLEDAAPPPERRENRPVHLAVLAAIGLLLGVAATLGGSAVVPDDCGAVVTGTDAERLLRTKEAVTADEDRGEEMLTCTWRTEGGADDETRRASSLTVSVAEHPRFGDDPAVEQVRTYADLESATTPVGLGDEAVAVSDVKGGVAHAEVGAHDGRRSIRVVYTADDGDRVMAAYLAELAVREAMLGGPSQ